MATKQLVWIIGVLVLCSFVSATHECTEQSANVSVNCTIGGGAYFVSEYSNWNNPDKMMDGVLDSNFGTLSNDKNGSLYINYTKLLRANHTIWYIAHTEVLGTPITYNSNSYVISNTSNPDCWAQEPLQFQVFANSTGDDMSFYYCWDSSSWVYLGNTTTDVVYEEWLVWTLDISLDNCTNSLASSTNVTAVNVTFFDENLAPTTVVYETIWDYGSTTTYTGNFSMTNTDNSFLLCIYPNGSTIYGDGLINYNNLTYNTYQLELSNNVQEISLYTQTGTTEVTFTVVDYGGDTVQDAYIHIMKYDVGTNSYYTTEVLRTDSAGQAVGEIVLGIEYYRFIIQYEGVTELIDPATQGVKIYTTTRTFRISIDDTDWFDDYDVSLGIAHNVSFNDATNSFTFTWTDPSAEMHLGCLQVIKRNRTGDTTLFDNCTQSASASIVYAITPVNGSRYIGTGYFIFDNIFIANVVEKFFSFGFELYDVGDSTFSLLMSTLLIMALALIGIPFPELGFILMSVGMFFTAIIGLWQVTWVLVSAIVIIGVIHMWKGYGK